MGRVVTSGSEGSGSKGSRGRNGKGRDDAGLRRSGRRVASSRDAQAGPGDASEHADGFVDARRLRSEDLVSKTLKETSGSLGMIARPKIVDFSARLKERRHANARVIAVRAGVVMAACLAVAGLIWLLFFSSVFRLQSSSIVIAGGNEWVSSQQIMSIADKQADKSLFLVSTSAVTAELNDIPGVTSATAKKNFPQGMTVSITAQRPAAMLKSGDSSLTAVDAKGRVLNSVKGASVKGIPVIQVGDVNSGLRSRAVLSTLRILSDLPETMRQRISKVSAQTQDSITTELDSGRYTIVWGDDSNFTLKQAVVDKIINDPSKIGDKHQVDVSAPLRPIIK